MKVQLQLLILLAQVVEYFVKGKKMICIMVHYYDQALYVAKLLCRRIAPDHCQYNAIVITYAV